MWNQDDDYLKPPYEPVWYKGEQIGHLDRIEGQIQISPLLNDRDLSPPTLEPGNVLNVRGAMVYNTMGELVGQLGPGNTLEPWDLASNDPAGNVIIGAGPPPSIGDEVDNPGSPAANEMQAG